MINVIISINIHEKVNFLYKQLNNIDNYVKLNYKIILNCNEYMYRQLINNSLINNNSKVIVNKIYFNKRRFSGTLIKGIYFNLLYALDHFDFEYFVILSSRTLFYQELNLNNYKNINKYYTNYTYKNILKEQWHWTSFLKMKLGTFILKNNQQQRESQRNPHPTHTKMDYFYHKKPNITGQ